MATTPTKLMTFAEFEKLPDSPRRYELRHGEPILLAPPAHVHYRVQRQFRRLLETAAGDVAIVDTEMPFRPLPEYEYWYADVGLVVVERWDRIPPREHLQGAPELVVEVLSPSNTVAEMRDRKKLCLGNGSQQFWVADIDQREVEVSTPDGHSVTYKSGQQIPLFFAPGSGIAVDEIFPTETT